MKTLLLIIFNLGLITSINAQKLYKCPDAKINITIPEKWYAAPSMGVEFMIRGSNSTMAESLTCMTDKKSKLELKAQSDSLITSIETSRFVKKYEFIKDETVEINDDTFVVTEYSFKMMGNLQRGIVYVCKHNDMYYHFTCFTPIGNYDESSVKFRKIIESIEWQ